jgi:hypothetical protein
LDLLGRGVECTTLAAWSKYRSAEPRKTSGETTRSAANAAMRVAVSACPWSRRSSITRVMK